MSIFGNNSSTFAPKPAGASIFGNTTPAQPSNSTSIFGANPSSSNTGTPATGSIFGGGGTGTFGQQTQQPQAGGTNIFGQSNPGGTGTSLFGAQNNQQQQSGTGTGLFGQSNTGGAGAGLLGVQNNQQQQGGTGTGLFGQSNAPGAGTGFGQNQQQQGGTGTGLFGQSNAPGAGTGFGQNQQQQGGTGTGLFGQSNAPGAGTGFGQNQQQQGGTGTGLFGQSNAPGAGTGFGQNQQQQSGAAPGTGVFGGQQSTGGTGTGLFGQGNQQQQGASGTGLFGQSNTGGTGTNLFGGQQQQGLTGTGNNLFGTGGTGTNVFGNFGQNTQQPAVGTSLFGQNTGGTGNSMFGQQPQQPQQQQGSLFGGASAANPFGANTQQNQTSLWGRPGAPQHLQSNHQQPPPFTKTTKFNDLPEEIKKFFEHIDTHIQGRVQISKELHQRKLGEEATKGQEIVRSVNRDLIHTSTTIRNDLQFTKDLKAKADQAVQDTIVATRIIDGFRNTQANGAYLKDHASFPLEFFTRITRQTKERLAWYKSTIEQIERKLSSMANQPHITPQRIVSALQAQHATFLALSGRTATLDTELQKIKTMYTQLWRARTGSVRDPFDGGADMEQSLRPGATKGDNLTLSALNIR
ncbi:hypothetical protein E1B28_011086 [Marasmius oreades]|uniref:Nucleoporin p58/p45 n=1 Tax=Marasmius oreades TaxID=181124 RepID=A0A9P7RUQ5_9AGAR|nr:uncharacterized protein E1B28_011086 [Marasmius oreades]KAG7089398.1 hypothetical protein E1B28_011086 [Marasmius oreades]